MCYPPWEAFSGSPNGKWPLCLPLWLKHSLWASHPGGKLQAHQDVMSKGWIHGAWWQSMAGPRVSNVSFCSPSRKDAESTVLPSPASAFLPQTCLTRTRSRRKGRCVLQTNEEGKRDAGTDIIALLMPYKAGCSSWRMNVTRRHTVYRAIRGKHG